MDDSSDEMGAAEVETDGEQEVEVPKTHFGRERIRELVIRTFEDVHALVRSNDRISGLRAGYPLLDELTSGMHRGDLTILAGRPGMGKTSLALNIAVNASHSRVGTSEPAGVLIFSLEMPKDQIVRRMLASEARVDADRLRKGQLYRDDWGSLAQAASTLSELPIFIEDQPRVTMKHLRARIEEHIGGDGALALIVIDNVQLIQPEIRSERRDREIGDTARELKLTARELNVPILALSALNRGPAQRGDRDRRPRLDDLRDSGALEDEADVVLLLHREEMFSRETVDKGIAEILVAKQRGGPRGEVRVSFSEEFTRFDGLEDVAAKAAEDAEFG